MKKSIEFKCKNYRKRAALTWLDCGLFTKGKCWSVSLKSKSFTSQHVSAELKGDYDDHVSVDGYESGWGTI